MKGVLLSQMKWIYDTPQEGWFPNLSDALEGLKFEEASKKKDSDSHSIWDTLNHLVYWNDRNLQKFKNPKTHLPEEMENDSSFIQEHQEKSNDNWIQTMDKAHQVFSHWIDMVEESTEERLNEKLSEQDTRIAYDVISHMTIHNAYHIGQIILMRKLAKDWTNKY